MTSVNECDDYFVLAMNTIFVTLYGYMLLKYEDFLHIIPRSRATTFHINIRNVGVTVRPSQENGMVRDKERIKVNLALPKMDCLQI